MVEALAEEAAGLVWSCALDVADQGGSTETVERRDPDDEADDADDAEQDGAPAEAYRRGDQTLQDIAEALGIVRERTRQIEAQAMRKFKRNAIGMGLRHVAEGLGERDVKPTIEG